MTFYFYQPNMVGKMFTIMHAHIENFLQDYFLGIFLNLTSFLLVLDIALLVTFCFWAAEENWWGLGPSSQQLQCDQPLWTNEITSGVLCHAVGPGRGMEPTSQRSRQGLSNWPRAAVGQLLRPGLSPTPILFHSLRRSMAHS